MLWLGVSVLLKDNPILDKETVFIDSNDRLLVLDVTFSSGKSFKLVDVYVHIGSG